MVDTDKKKKSIDPASLQAIDKAAANGVNLAFDRALAMKPCPIGEVGSCCKNCSMGPCRVPLPKNKTETVEEKKKRRGICGATAETIAARNFARMVAAGAAAHSDHGRAVAELLLAVGKGEASGYQIRDEQKLLGLCMDFHIPIGERTNLELAAELAGRVLAEFGGNEGHLTLAQRAPLPRQEIWRQNGVSPRGIDREIVELMHRTSAGVDQDYRNVMQQAVRASLSDGWGGSMIATELQDILFGTPAPVLGQINLGVLKEDEVNVVIHGHEPLLSEVIVSASHDPEILELARASGARGINLAGQCCTANEILMRHGIPLAGNFLQQELAIVTGAVDAMVVDVQCIMESLPDVASCYHTQLITTSPKGKITGARHVEFDEHRALESAKEVLKIAIEAFGRRSSRVEIPQHKADLVAGFSHETINYMQGGVYRSSYRPLNDNIINGRIRGVAGVVGCNNARVTHNEAHVAMVKELIKNDVLVLQTGCSAMASAMAGLMVPEAAAEFAGPGLASVCEAIGIPPVLHLGSCVDNSRILIAATAMVKDGGLGDDISDLPVAGAAPEWFSEKAITIGQYFVASGIYTVFGVTWPTLGSPELTDYLFYGFNEMYGASWAFESDAVKAAHLMIDHIDEKRKVLGISHGRPRVLYDMAMRRDL